MKKRITYGAIAALLFAGMLVSCSQNGKQSSEQNMDSAATSDMDSMAKAANEAADNAEAVQDSLNQEDTSAAE